MCSAPGCNGRPPQVGRARGRGEDARVCASRQNAASRAADAPDLDGRDLCPRRGQLQEGPATR
eukprot:859688-Prymnesium_polylepis.1